jgi:hypothetical protein
MTETTCYCAGCIGVGPGDHPIQSDECGNCALEADHFGPCASTAETPDCYDCGRQWADCACEGPMS